MNYYSINQASSKADFREATLNGQAPDGGLYFPERIPVIDPQLIRDIRQLSPEDIALHVIEPYIGSAIPRQELQRIVRETVDFPFPLIPITESIFALELFHGPTLAFKDVGARFMSRCLGFFSREEHKRSRVLVATSGDTGGAVADGFYQVEGVDVVILYPSGKVSGVQEKQLTTHGHNIHALEVNGNFDDCQRLVKQAFADHRLSRELNLTSANSINIARWLPQQFYYFFALQQWQQPDPPVFSVPSGNFGNICAGLLAWKSGLPVAHFIAACNENDTVPRWFNTGKYSPEKAKATLSNAMDVGDPSNFIRILELFQHDNSSLKKVMSSISFSDKDTRDAIKYLWQEHQYMADPHGAVAFNGLTAYQKSHPAAKGIFLETAHPVKFPEVVEEVIGQPIPVPEKLLPLLEKEKKSTRIDPDFSLLKDFLYAV